MKPAITRLLLPVTLDSGFWQAAGRATQMAKDTGASVTLALIDDDSPFHEIVPLPFHGKEFVHRIGHSAEVSANALNDRAARFLTEAVADGIQAGEILAKGHTATQILLLSRFYDTIIMSSAPQFPMQNGAGARRAAPLLEILDQAVTPVLLAGESGKAGIESASIFFDGGPCATLALQGFCSVLASQPETHIYIRVCLIDEPVARRLAGEAASYLRSKGFENVSIEYSEKDPIEATTSKEFTSTDLVAMGIRSRNMFHDLRIGILAKHFLENETTVHRLFG